MNRSFWGHLGIQRLMRAGPWKGPQSRRAGGEVTWAVWWAGLEVFAEEPLPPESPLWGRPNVLVSPHSDRGA